MARAADPTPVGAQLHVEVMTVGPTGPDIVSPPQNGGVTIVTGECRWTSPAVVRLRRAGGRKGGQIACVARVACVPAEPRRPVRALIEGKAPARRHRPRHRPTRDQPRRHAAQTLARWHPARLRQQRPSAVLPGRVHLPVQPAHRPQAWPAGLRLLQQAVATDPHALHELLRPGDP